MKKLLCTAAVLIAVTMPAQAEGLFNPYIGADYQYTSVSFDGGDNEGASGFNIHIGNRFNDYVGLELGYFRTGDISADGNVLGVPVSIDAKLYGVTLDALGYLSVTQDKSFELIGTAGVSYIRAEADATIAGITVSDDESEWGFRAGAGAQYNITEQVNVRGLARYQTADFDDVADDAWIYTLGVNYSF